MSLFHRSTSSRFRSSNVPERPVRMAKVSRRQLLAGMVASATGGLSLLGTAFASPLIQVAQAAQGPLPVLPAWHEPQPQASHPLAGSILVAESNRRLSPAALVDWAQAHPLLVLGEHRGNPNHHLLERWLVEALAARRRLGGVALEMFDTQQDAALSLVNRTALAAAGLPDEELKQLLAWNGERTFSGYAPLLRSVLGSGAPLASASLRTTEIQAVMAADTIAPALPEAVLRLQREALDEGYCGLLGAEHLDAVLRAQLARDQQMAEQLEKLASNDATALLVCGGGHARCDIGVPRWLEQRSLSIALMPVAWDESGQPLTHLKDYLPESAGATSAYDLVWFTPTDAPLKDSGAGLREADAIIG